ncbi:MAG: group II intron reverse transcriptase/maturase [Acidobacteriota bacterium]|nr:group II intron reverse transcriptase/maturase [Acidobacteriota bacterium]
MNERIQGNREGTLKPEGHAPGTRLVYGQSLSTELNRISETAKQYPTYTFRTVAHLINVELLTESFRQLRKDAAAGVDEITARDYQKNLQRNLEDLHRRLREGRYRAQSLRRVYIDKEDGKKRPLSIPALEDKVVQKATADILSRIYEQDFLSCSFGYRPRRNAHDAVGAVWQKITLGKASYVLEADIRDYFGSIVRKELKQMLQKRIADQAVLRLIGKWLQVGVVEDGKLLMSEDGTYQGSVISPLLANVYLHEVLDLWVEQIVKPRMRGEISLCRFADDFVVCFQYRSDAERFQQVLPKRFAKYGLTLHPDKTRLLAFGRFAEQEARRTGRRKPETFDFLGFTFYCGKTREGKFSVKLKTKSKRLGRGLLRVAAWCRKNRHQPLSEQRARLAEVLQGHYQYYGLRSNARSLAKFFQGVRSLWRKWLGRRSRSTAVSWGKFEKILKKYPLPRPRITQGQRRNQLMLFGEFA